MWSPQNAGSDPALRSHLHVDLECGIRPGSDPSPKEDLILGSDPDRATCVDRPLIALADLILLVGSTVNTVSVARKGSRFSTLWFFFLLCNKGEILSCFEHVGFVTFEV